MRKIINAIRNPRIVLIYFINMMRFLDDITYLKLRYRIEFGKRLDFENPKTFNEKLNWLKVYDRNSEYKRLVDKYEVREYVAEMMGEDHLIPLLGVYNSFDEINFDELPDQFVIKCTHDSGSVIICKDKSSFDYEAARKKINRKMKKDLYWWAREWVYKDIKPRIVIEKFMSDSENGELKDYKFFCFNGRPEYVYVSRNLSIHELGEISFYDMNFNRAPFYRSDFKPISEELVPPVNFEEMKRLAAEFSKGMKFLRVDFYEIENKIYFGELTFYTTAGYMPIVPKEWDYKLGQLMYLN